MIQEIFVVEDSPKLTNILNCKFKKSMGISLKHILPTNLRNNLPDIPSLILINVDNIDTSRIDILCNIIKENEDNAATPIVAASENLSISNDNQLLKAGVHFCIKRLFTDEALYATVRNIVYLVLLNRGISPLTKLPRKFAYSV